MYQNILVPIDGSATSAKGLAEAIRLASHEKARLHIINVVDDMLLAQNYEVFDASGAGDFLDALRATGRRTLAGAASEATAAGVTADTTLVESHGARVADAIVGYSKKCKADLIVMGTHGRRGLSRVVLGSDAESVLRETSVPILLIRPHPHKHG